LVERKLPKLEVASSNLVVRFSSASRPLRLGDKHVFEEVDSLEQANAAVADLCAGRFRGAAVLSVG
jgi:hypothetical protein